MKKILLLMTLLFGMSCTINHYQAPDAGPKKTDYIGNAYRSVALLVIENSDGGKIAATGFAYDKDHLITAGHFCIGALEIQVFDLHTQAVNMSYYNDNMEMVSDRNVEIVELSKTQDLCMLKKENHGLTPLKIYNDYNNLKIRDNVTIVGFPAGTSMGEFDGKIMSLHYNGLGGKAIKGKMVVSSAATGGISGSPIILTDTGEVVGVLVMGHVYFDHLSFGITGEDLNIFVNEFKE